MTYVSKSTTFFHFQKFLKKLHGIAPVKYPMLSKLETIEAGFFLPFSFCRLSCLSSSDGTGIYI